MYFVHASLINHVDERIMFGGIWNCTPGKYSVPLLLGPATTASCCCTLCSKMRTMARYRRGEPEKRRPGATMDTIHREGRARVFGRYSYSSSSTLSPSMIGRDSRVQTPASRKSREYLIDGLNVPQVSPKIYVLLLGTLFFEGR